MIDRVNGLCLRKTPTEVIVTVGGLGLSIAIPLSTFERIGMPGHEVSLLTYLHVREDVLELYGFSTSDERDLFKVLLTVTGVGPKMALSILSRFTPNELYSVVADRDIRRLTTIKGVGQKKAERLMVELKGRFDSVPIMSSEAVSGQPSAISEAVQALETLGFSIRQADEAVRKAQKNIGEDAPVEELVRNALKG